jgi:hypothetical protein
MAPPSRRNGFIASSVILSGSGVQAIPCEWLANTEEATVPDQIEETAGIMLAGAKAVRVAAHCAELMSIVKLSRLRSCP